MTAPVTTKIDHETLARIADWVAEARAEIGEKRWAELQAEWEQ